MRYKQSNSPLMVLFDQVGYCTVRFASLLHAVHFSVHKSILSFLKRLIRGILLECYIDNRKDLASSR